MAAKPNGNGMSLLVLPISENVFASSTSRWLISLGSVQHNTQQNAVISNTRSAGFVEVEGIFVWAW
jgi:hypothetical protein